MIETLTEKTQAWINPLPGGKPGVFFVSRCRAVKDCGCAVYVGVRTDNHETTAIGVECSEEHDGFMNEVMADLHQSLDNPTDRRLIDVVNELLCGEES